jgi:hypothetical protein
MTTNPARCVSSGGAGITKDVVENGPYINQPRCPVSPIQADLCRFCHPLAELMQLVSDLSRRSA